MKTEKNTICVLGSDRSGTSLVTSLLSKCGASLSENFVFGSEQNRKGIFEDRYILDAHRELFSILGTDHNLPVPENFLEYPGVNALRGRLAAYVTDKVEGSSTIWAFKDPRTALFLPLWTRLFEQTKIVPKYILCVRNPSSVVASLVTQYNDVPACGEIFWLTKNIDALRHTGGNVFILHYESLFEEGAKELIQSLLEFTGLDEFITSDIQEVLSNTVVPSFNKSQWQPYTVKNRWVNKLYSALNQYKGAEFDSSSLMPVVYDCQKVMDEFSGWTTTACNLLNSKNQKIKQFELKIEKGTQGDKKSVSGIEKEKNRLLSENVRLKEEKKLLLDKIELNKKEYEKEKQAIRNECKKNDQVGRCVTVRVQPALSSYKFRLGNIFVRLAKNKKRIFVVPFELIFLVFDMVTCRGRSKQLKELETLTSKKAASVKQSTSFRLGTVIFSFFASISESRKLQAKIRKLYVASIADPGSEKI